MGTGQPAQRRMRGVDQFGASLGHLAGEETA